VFHGDTALKNLCIKKDFEVERYKNEIVLYKAWYDDGFLTLYQNKSKDKNLEELIEFKMQGLEIEGLEGETRVSVELPPQSEKLIKLRNTGAMEERKLTSKILNKKITQWVKKNEDEF